MHVDFESIMLKNAPLKSIKNPSSCRAFGE